MPRIFKHFSRTETIDYPFPDVTQDFEEVEDPEAFEPLGGPLPQEDEDETGFSVVDEPEEAHEEAEEEPVSLGKAELDFAKVQADAILMDAHRQAAQMLQAAREEAEAQAEEIFRKARADGFQQGYADGTQQALEEGRVHREEEAVRLQAEVDEFLRKAGRTLDRHLDENLDDLRDLAIAIAEKIICVSLKSSTEIIGKMVQAALDKRKSREWVHIYIAECDARRMSELPQSLMNAVSSLSNRVRIIPMADDDSGTCIIEMPEGIIDASVSTQMSNIRNMLSEIQPQSERRELFRL